MPDIVIQINDFQVAETQVLSGNTVFTPLNSLVQIGDSIHYAVDNGSGVLSDTTEVGEITGFNGSGYIEVSANDDAIPPNNAFILFSKKIQINESSVKGYYADVTLKNSSTKRAELFALSSDVVPSSK